MFPAERDLPKSDNVVISFLGTRNQAEREYLRIYLANNLGKHHVVEFASNFKGCGCNDYDRYDDEPFYDHLDTAESESNNSISSISID